MEDEISIDASIDEPKKHITESDVYGASKDNVRSNVHHKSHVNTLKEVDHNAHRSQNLLVLEVFSYLLFLLETDCCLVKYMQFLL